jgi:hypothetical protein
MRQVRFVFDAELLRSFRRRWMRVWALLGLVFVYAVALVLAVSGRVPGDQVLIVSLVQIPLAYAVALWSVGRARCGDPTPVQARDRRRTSRSRVAKSRAWKIVNATLCLVVLGAVVLSGWIGANPQRTMQVADVLARALPFLAAVKIGTLAVLIERVRTAGLYPVQRICCLCGGWILAIACTTVLYLAYAPSATSMFNVLCGLIVFFPILGIVGAPLALHWNRSR